MTAHSAGQAIGQRAQSVFHVSAGATHVAQAERDGGCFQITQLLGEKGAVFGFAYIKTCLCDEVAEWQRRGQAVLVSVQMGMYLLDQQFQCGVIHDQVMVMKAK